MKSHVYPIYRCRLCERVWTGALPVYATPHRLAAEPQGPVPHLCGDPHVGSVGVSDIVGWKQAGEGE